MEEMEVLEGREERSGNFEQAPDVQRKNSNMKKYILFAFVSFFAGAALSAALTVQFAGRQAESEPVQSVELIEASYRAGFSDAAISCVNNKFEDLGPAYREHAEACAVKFMGLYRQMNE